MDSKELAEKLEEFPQLKARFEALLRIAENSDGKIELADDAEEMILAAGQALERETLQQWADKQSAMKAIQFEKQHTHAHKDSKKK